MQNGYHGTSIREISRESGIGIGPIYDYFKNKEEILFTVHKRIVEANYSNIKECLRDIDHPVEMITKAIKTQLNLVKENQDLYLYIYKEGHLLGKKFRKEIMRIEKKTIALVEDILKEGQKRKMFRRFNCRVAANMIILLNHGWVLKRWDLGDIGRPHSHLSFTVDFILRAISL
jgi:AcrR family transcriptional regulator